ncbi:hypothetical protein [Pseudoalteromonas sp. APC 4017]|uniref:hypothetical protein n=1 Tax=Pseudoalteromonas sp. APC 4017 TaxID=3035174 RepID=UPI0025B2D575|nr:hypothetical protein [Pseudoalteromonas sp. APC 4017]MDN3379129.1 hypothetical protein [Pseudoalteromonas sp. APC 3893]
MNDLKLGEKNVASQKNSCRIKTHFIILYKKHLLLTLKKQTIKYAERIEPNIIVIVRTENDEFRLLNRFIVHKSTIREYKRINNKKNIYLELKDFNKSLELPCCVKLTPAPAKPTI